MKSLFLSLLLLFSIKVISQVDTVRWYDFYDFSIRKSTNPNMMDRPIIYDKTTKVIVERYNQDSIFLKKMVTFNEYCLIEDYHEYHTNGKPKVTGFFQLKESDSLIDSLCGKKTGVWSTYTASGELIECELWSNGVFEKEIIKYDTNAVWKAVLTVNGKKYNLTRSSEDIKKKMSLNITLHYKNEQSIGKEHHFELIYFRNTVKLDSLYFKTPDSFNSFNHNTWMKKKKPKFGDRIFISVIDVLRNNYLYTFNLLY